MWFLAAMVAGAFASSDFNQPTATLAARLLPHDLASRVVSHELGMAITAGGPPTSVAFFERGHIDGRGYCIRQRLSVYIGNDGKPHEAPIASTQLRLGGCDGRYAYLNPGVSLDAARSVLAFLDRVHRDELEGRSVLLDFNCKSGLPNTSCDRHKVLATLDAGDVMIISMGPSQKDWLVNVSPVETIVVDNDQSPPAVHVDWEIPAPF